MRSPDPIQQHKRVRLLQPYIGQRINLQQTEVVASPKNLDFRLKHVATKWYR